MSTYVNPASGKKNDYSDCPAIVSEFLKYSETIKGLSSRSVNAYYIDLRTFFRFLMLHRKLVDPDIDLAKIDIQAIDLDFIRQVNKSEIYEFLYYVTRERDNASATRARKLSSLKGFFKYLTNKTSQLTLNPTDDVETPKNKKTLPKHLTLEESTALLNNIQSDFYERDYCIITLFLSCGMRLSELVGVNLNDIKEDSLRIVGKGNKERLVYLNEACQSSIANYAAARLALPNLRENAFFVSKRTGRRLTARRVQQIVNNCLAAAGLDGKGYSVHKLRHTAATLMYQYGHVDMLVLKELLGHANLATTEIYTHLDSVQLKNAAEASPLSGFTPQVTPLPHENLVENSDENVENSESHRDTDMK